MVSPIVRVYITQVRHERLIKNATAAGILMFAAMAMLQADTSKEARYSAIPTRNAFGLKPPPEPAPPPPPPPPTTTVKLTGIVSFAGTQRAVLQVQEQGKQPESKLWTVGQGEGNVQVLAISIEDRTVKIQNGDREQELNMEKDGVKVPTAPPPAAPPQPGMPVPGQPPVPGAVMPGLVPPAPTAAAPPAPAITPLPVPTLPVPGATGESAQNPAMISRPVRPPSSDRAFIRIGTNVSSIPLPGR